MWSRRTPAAARGLSLVEILVVAGLLSLLAVAFVHFRLNAAATDAGHSARQEYHERLALLSARVKDDLRSAVSIRRDGEGRYTLVRLERGGGGALPREAECVYERTETGDAVLRRAGDTVERFDFGPWLDGRPFVFRIGE